MLKFKLLASAILLLLISSCSNDKANTSEQTTTKTDSAGQRQIKTVLFFGNSLTAGYGLDDPSEAFPALVQDSIDSLGLPYKIINAGLSGETSSGGNSRIDWLLRQKIDVFVLELGANDGLRGIAVAETSKNLQSIITKVKNKYPDVKLVLTGMQVPPNMGSKYAGSFRLLFSELAAKNNMTYVPFLLEGVGGIPILNQQDGIHPTAEGHKILARNVWKLMKDIL